MLNMAPSRVLYRRVCRRVRAQAANFPFGGCCHPGGLGEDFERSSIPRGPAFPRGVPLEPVQSCEIEALMEAFIYRLDSVSWEPV